MDPIRENTLQYRSFEEHQYHLQRQESCSIPSHIAFVDWVAAGYAERIRLLFQQDPGFVDDICRSEMGRSPESCNGVCLGVGYCRLPFERIHDLFSAAERLLEVTVRRSA